MLPIFHWIVLLKIYGVCVQNLEFLCMCSSWRDDQRLVRRLPLFVSSNKDLFAWKLSTLWMGNFKLYVSIVCFYKNYYGSLIGEDSNNVILSVKTNETMDEEIITLRLLGVVRQRTRQSWHGFGEHRVVVMANKIDNITRYICMDEMR